MVQISLNICLCSVTNGTSLAQEQWKSRIAQLHKQSLKSWFVKNDTAWFHTGSGSPSFSVTCITSFAELAFSNALSFHPFKLNGGFHWGFSQQASVVRHLESWVSQEIVNTSFHIYRILSSASTNGLQLTRDWTLPAFDRERPGSRYELCWNTFLFHFMK